MILKSRQNYLTLQTEDKLFLVSELHLMRDALKAKRGEKKVRAKRPKKVKKPLLSPKMLEIFNTLPPESQELILYGKKR